MIIAPPNYPRFISRSKATEVHWDSSVLSSRISWGRLWVLRSGNLADVAKKGGLKANLENHQNQRYLILFASEVLCQFLDNFLFEELLQLWHWLQGSAGGKGDPDLPRLWPKQFRQVDGPWIDRASLQAVLRALWSLPKEEHYGPFPREKKNMFPTLRARGLQKLFFCCSIHAIQQMRFRHSYIQVMTNHLSMFGLHENASLFIGKTFSSQVFLTASHLLCLLELWPTLSALQEAPTDATLRVNVGKRSRWAHWFASNGPTE